MLVSQWQTLCLLPVLLQSSFAETDKPRPSVIFHVKGSPASLHFIDANNEATFLETIQPGEPIMHVSAVGHMFRLSIDGGEEPYVLTVRGSCEVSCDVRPGEAFLRCHTQQSVDLSKYSGEQWDAFVSNWRAKCHETYRNDTAANLAHFCDFDPTNNVLTQCKYEMTEEEFNKTFQPYYDDGQKTVAEQPPLFQNFSKTGHEVAPIDAALMEELRAFWLEKRLTHSRPENHPKMDAALSGCQSNTWILGLPEDLREKVRAMVQPALAKWIGVNTEDMELINIHGIRMYMEGAVLHMHVDRRTTHAVSAILEVGHLEYGRPDTDWDRPEQWPLEIADHNGTRVHVASKAGQLIMYESATCPHGRPTPFPGREFANIFAHFRPKGWPEKYYSVQSRDEL